MIDDPEFVLLNYHDFIELSHLGEMTPLPAPKPITPRPWAPGDTEKTLYRVNHVKDEDWYQMSYNARVKWANQIQKENPGKTVVW